MSNALEHFVGELNQHFFLREYSYSTNRFTADNGEEFELADHVIALPDATFIFQLKERSDAAAANASALTRWFKESVVKKACGQIANSLSYLTNQSALNVANERGHVHNLASSSRAVIPIIIYRIPATAGEFAGRVRHHVSKRAAFVHILRDVDYLKVCEILVLPRELREYFDFRRDLLLRYPQDVGTEIETVARFMANGAVLPENAGAAAIVRNAVDDITNFDISPILRKFADKITFASGNDGLGYYRILAEFSRMNRTEMRGFKGLFDWALEKAGSSSKVVPVRMKTSNGGGLVIIPISAHNLQSRFVALRYLTDASKYDWRLLRQIGLSVARDGEDVLLDWCFIEGEWLHDAAFERLLREDYPFHLTPCARVVTRYPITST